VELHENAIVAVAADSHYFDDYGVDANIAADTYYYYHELASDQRMSSYACYFVASVGMLLSVHTLPYD